MKRIAIGWALLGASFLSASPLGDYLRCGAELLPQSRGKLIASQRVPGWFALPQHTLVDVYSVTRNGQTQAATYVLPEKGLLTDSGDRVFFLRVVATAKQPLFLSLVQTLAGNWLTENTLPTTADEDHYSEVIADNSVSGGATERLHAELLVRLADVPRYRGLWNRRFPKNPLPARLEACGKVVGLARVLTSEK